MVVALRISVEPSHSDPLLLAAGAEGTGFTVIVTVLDEALAGLAHAELEVNIAAITSPSEKTALNVGLLGPVETPFTVHW
jgi:hypothetical protein